MKYKAIGFDWGGVLNGKPGHHFGQDAARQTGVSYENFQKAYFHHNAKVNRGEITWLELWQLVLAELNKPELTDTIYRLSESYQIDKLNSEVLTLVDRLRNNYRVGLLSNNTSDKAARMRASGLETHFDTFLISCEINLVKPDPDAFKLLAEELGVAISELAYIDDSLISLSRAAEAGFTPIHFSDYETLLLDLAKLQIITG